MAERALQLVAPWWGWPKQLRKGTAASPRQTRPHLQKFDRPDFVEGFLEDPQRSFQFMPDDEVSTFTLASGLDVTVQGIRNKAELLFGRKTLGGGDLPSAVVTRPTGLRKLYLDTHKRAYLVGMEVHCDAAGFPNATREEICQAGFVVRRRALSYDPRFQKEAKALLKEIAALQASFAQLSDAALALSREVPRRPTRAQKLKAEGGLAQARAELARALGEKRAALSRWKVEAGAHYVTEGWLPTPFDGVGEWALVEDAPGEVTEATFPLYPLVPAPDRPDHDAAGRAVYFGVVPTSALETTKDGRPRLDDQHTYEIRCFVRRHKAGCPRTEAVPDCHGELFWSAPNEPYRLAAPFDLVGTAQRPVTIQMPDLGEIAALAASRPLGRFSPVRMVQKQTLKPKVDGTSLSGGTLGAAATCFFAIPLITLVAVFLFNLFLPIVVFVFGLWFLLALRFCIPPSFSLDVGLQAELDALAALDVSVDLDASFSVTFTHPQTGITVTHDQAQVRAALLQATGQAALGGAPLSGGPLEDLETSELFGLTRTLDELGDLEAEGEAQEQTPPGLDLVSQLVFEPRETPGVTVR